MPNYYVFKGKRPRQEYIRLCKDEACIGMQDSEYIDILNFSKWMFFFLNYHERRKSLSPTKRFLLVLDGHKSHVSFEVLLKAKEHGKSPIPHLPCYVTFRHFLLQAIETIL